MRERESEREGESVYCEGHHPIHKEEVVSVHYTSALMFNESVDDVHCSSDSSYTLLHIE